MLTLFVATEQGLLIARHVLDWTVEHHLQEHSAECVAIDPLAPSRVYCGTLGRGVWRSDDGGRSWEPAGSGVTHPAVMSIAVSATESEGGAGVVYAGTEPSGVFRSADGGASWIESAGLLALPSKAEWSFPPRPDTHHVRWLEPDPVATGRLYVAIEAGALLRTPDGGRTWDDRVPGGPYDTHTAATHRLAPDRVYSAAGDGYFIQPTVIADVDPKARISQEEIFGPVLAVIKARDFDHALEIANNTEFGLTGGVYSRNKEKLEKAQEVFHVGNLYLNRKCTGAMVGAHPFGGFNMSGTDSKTGGKDYLLLFLQAKTVAEKI